MLAVPDETREEEVLACVVLHDDSAARAAADTLFALLLRAARLLQGAGLDLLHRRAADDRHAEDPEAPDLPAPAPIRTLPGMFDLRARKQR